MRTTYLTSLRTTFNPFSRTSHVPRLFLQLLPVNAHKSIKITQAVLPRTTKTPATLELGFKDGRTMTFSWAERAAGQRGVGAGAEGEKVKMGEKEEKQTQLADIVEEVERHARILGRKEELQG